MSALMSIKKSNLTTLPEAPGFTRTRERDVTLLHTHFKGLSFVTCFRGLEGVAVLSGWSVRPTPRCMTAENEAWVADCMTPKPQDPRIHGSYCAQTLYVHLRAPAAGERDCGVPRSLFCRFKTLVSFPEAAAFAWLDQADLGLSRRPRPSPLDGCSASHATCSTRGAAWRRTERERESPGNRHAVRRIRTAQRRGANYAQEASIQNPSPAWL